MDYEDQEAPVSRILDNRQAKLADYLNEHLPNSKVLRLVSAYFSIYGYKEIADSLKSVGEVRFLFGAPFSASTTVGEEKPPQSFHLTEGGLEQKPLESENGEEQVIPPEEVMQQQRLAEECAEWVGRNTPEWIGRNYVQVKTIKKRNFLHGKMYHINKADGSGAATVGSSNFTKSGLGKGKKSNIELNVSVDNAVHAELEAWFDKIWHNDDLTRTVNNELQDELVRWHKEYSPKFLYYKTLYELFYDKLKAELAEEQGLERSGLYNSEIWQDVLYEFQQDGAKRVISCLLEHNGCILADSVGLGKTYTALAVIKYFESRNMRVLVLCPKRLKENWHIYRTEASSARSPFKRDRFFYNLQSHSDLSSGKSMADFDWSNFDLIVIDESHNFRNQSTGKSKRYKKLMEDAIKSGGNTKVLLLSATPVNTSLLDLRNQIYLMTAEQDDAYASTLDIPSLKRTINEARKQFAQWRDGGSKDKNELLSMLGGDLQRLLGSVTVARSRTHIKEIYPNDAGASKFPKREKPVNSNPHIDTEESFRYEDVNELIEKVMFYVYKPSDFLWEGTQAQRRLVEEKEERNFNQKTREKYLIGMIHVNFLKRFESSAEALRLTLERTIGKIEAQILNIDEKVEGLEYDDEEDDDFIINAKTQNPYSPSDLNLQKWRSHMEQDVFALRKVLKAVQSVTPERDGKLQELKQRIRAKVTAGDNKKLLIFTTFKDTADYLYRHIAPLCESLGVNAAMVAGGNAAKRQGSHERSYSDILDAFSPVARNRADKLADGEEIDILIATDCISEGQNLHDCDTVLNYDIHWNPVRIIQRFGRIDRIGSQNESVKMINFWPHPDHDEYLNLRRRVVSRMALVDATATGGDNVLDQEIVDRANADNIEPEQEFRSDLAREMSRGNIPDLEDSSDSVTMGDLTLEYFRTQLLRYFQKNQKELKDAPAGIYAVTADTLLREHEGVIFLFKQKNPDEIKRNNPTHPFYLVHVGVDARVRLRHVQAAEILRLFEKASREDLPRDRRDSFHETHLSPNRAFARDLKEDEVKAQYDKIALAAVNDIEKMYIEAEFDERRKSLNSELKRRQSGEESLSNDWPLRDKKSLLYRLDGKPPRPNKDDLELITWLVIRPPQLS